MEGAFHAVGDSPLPSGDGESDVNRAEDAGWIRHWPEIQSHIAKKSRLLIALGFDGILSPTVSRPSEATLPAEMHSLLARLCASPRVALAFLSGRSLHDIRARIRLPDAYYVGNHGMELRGPGLTSSDGLAMSCRSDLVDAMALLTRCTKRLAGVLIEDKGMTITVHWRMTKESEWAALRELMNVVVQNHPRLKVFDGEACWELRARASWNKGDAISQLLSHLQLTAEETIYIGERFTDEDAFAGLRGGLSFCVGNEAAVSARYQLPSRADATQLLAMIDAEVNGSST